MLNSFFFLWGKLYNITAQYCLLHIVHIKSDNILIYDIHLSSPMLHN